MLKLLSTLPWRKAAPPPAGTAAVDAGDGTNPGTNPGTNTNDDSPPCGCGWFDSSHELQLGLQVQEHDGSDALAAELPLAPWLQLQLSGWRATLAA